MTKSPHHLSGINAVIWVRTVVFEVQQVEETLLVAIFEDGQALLHHCVIRMHEVHPVAAVIQVILGQCGHTEHVFVAESNSWEGHVVSPNHVDLCDSRVGHQVQDSIPGPRAKETNAQKEGHDPDDSLRFRLVRGENKLQTVDLGSHYKIHSDLFPCWFYRAGLCFFERSLLGIILSLRTQGDCFGWGCFNHN